MTASIMCAACRGAGGWGCGKSAVRCEQCGGTGEVPLRAAYPGAAAAIERKGGAK
jgi:DnaJ-class molecular chaperone